MSGDRSLAQCDCDEVPHAEQCDLMQAQRKQDEAFQRAIALFLGEV